MIKSPVPPTLRARFFYGTLLLLALATGSAQAGSDTWKGVPDSGDWSAAGNWVGGAIPNAEGWWLGNSPNPSPFASPDTATFDTSSITALSFSANVEVGGITFNPGADAYTLSVTPGRGLTFSGVGITNNSGVVQNFISVVDESYSFGAIVFANSATAGTNTAFTNQGSTLSFGFTGYTEFFNTSNAGSGTFTNGGGTGAGTFGGFTEFFDSASAGSATLIANGGTDGGGGGLITFVQDSTGGTSTVQLAGNGRLDISGHSIAGVTIGSLEGSGNAFLGANKLTVGSNGLTTTFSGVIQNGGLNGGTGASLAKVGDGMLTLTGANTYTGTTTVNKGTLSIDHDGSTTFGTLGGGAVTVNGASGSGGTLQFVNSASAGGRTFATNGGTTNGAVGGTTRFQDNSTAAYASFTTHGGTVDGAGGGQLYFLNSATAANGTFINNGGEVAGAGGIGGGAPGGYTILAGSSTAANGFFINGGGTVVADADGGHTFFFENSTAAQSTLISSGGTISGANGGTTEFYENSTAAASALFAYGGEEPGAGGGSIQFHGNSTGGTTAVAVYDNGNLDISPHAASGVTIGSLEGSGEVFLGARTLSVGSNNNSTYFSGVIQDGGLAGGTVGAFEKIGTGTLELAGASTYTGTTLVSAGTVVINNGSGSAFGTGAVTVASGTTLTGGGGFAGTFALNGLLSPGNSAPGTLSAGTTTFGGGGSFLWEINSVNGVAGVDSGWDLLSISGGLNIGATSGTPFTVNLISMDLFNGIGEVSDFDESSDYSFVFASTIDGVSDFSADKFVIDLDGFQNAFTGTWSVELIGSDLNLVYSAGAAVPEPSTYAAIAGAAMLGFAFWRRRRQQARMRS